MIHWELCKWYMHSQASVLVNKTHKYFWYFEIQKDHLILARQTDLIIINKKKKNWKIVDFAIPALYRVELKECEKGDKYLDLAKG